MGKKYPNLGALLSDDCDAKAFFESLPQYAKEMIRQRPDTVNSMASLMDYADNVTRGDN